MNMRYFSGGKYKGSQVLISTLQQGVPMVTPVITWISWDPWISGGPSGLWNPFISTSEKKTNSILVQGLIYIACINLLQF